MSRVLGIDVGDVRIGLALSDTMGILASPLTIIENSTEKQAVDAILKIVQERGAERIVVGLPRLMNGDIGPQAQKVQVFAEAIRSQTKIPVEYRDERLTTVTAQRLHQESGAKRKKGPKGIVRYDAMAAAVILQDYLEEQAAMKKQVNLNNE
jgi:putative Holliday junction resolvase